MAHIQIDSDGFIVVHDCYEQRKIVGDIGGAWDGIDKVWRVIFTAYNLEYLLDNLENLSVPEGLEALVEKQLEKEQKLLQIREMSKQDVPVSFKIPGLKLPLRNYQKLGVMFAVENGAGVLNGDHMGLGKCEKKSSIIASENGFIAMGKLFDEHADIESLDRDNTGGEWYRLKKKLKVLGFVSSGLQFQEVCRFYREKVKQACDIRLSNGYTIGCGLRHAFLSPRGWCRAENLNNGDWVGLAGRIDIANPVFFDPDLAELIGWQIGEGSESATTGSFTITQQDIVVLQRLKSIFDSLGFKKFYGGGSVKCSIRNYGNDTPFLHATSIRYRRYLESIGYKFGAKSGGLVVPECIKNSQDISAKRFLRAYWDADGCCNDDDLEITSKSEQLIRDVCFMLLRFGIIGVVRSKKVMTKKGKQTYWRMTIGGLFARRFLKEIGFGYEYKQQALIRLCGKTCNTNWGDSVPCRDELKEIIDLTDISSLRLGFGGVYVSDYSLLQYPSKELACRIADTLEDILLNGLEPLNNSRWGKRRQRSIRLVAIHAKRLREIVDRIRFLASRDIIWVSVDTVNKHSYDDYVYDMQISGSPNYIGDLAISHNTLQGIATALYWKSQHRITNALIVTPASLKYNWPIEIDKFCDEKYVVIDGTGGERIAQWLMEDVFFYIVNYELIIEDLFGGKKFEEKINETASDRVRRESRVAKTKQRERILAPLRRRVWGAIIADECHAIRSHGARRTVALKLLHANFRMALTGTPMDGRLEELHSIMGFVAPGLLGSKARFFQRHVETDFYGRVTGYKRLSEVTKRIEPFFIRRLKQDVLRELPDKIYENKIITLSPEEMKIYKELAKGGHEATADEEAIVAVIRCKQFCNYPQMIEPTCSKMSKMEAFKEILDEVVIQNGHKALVFSQYKTMLDFIVPVLDEMGLKYFRIDGDTPPRERAAIQQKFNTDSKIDLVIGTDAMAFGLNLTGASFCINMDDSWSPSTMEQRCDRAHRLGQKNVVTVVNFICKGTIEEKIRGVLAAKNKITAEVLGDETDEMLIRRLSPKQIASLL